MKGAFKKSPASSQALQIRSVERLVGWAWWMRGRMSFCRAALWNLFIVTDGPVRLWWTREQVSEKALPLLPAMPLISPRAAAEVLIKVKCKNSPGQQWECVRRAAEMIKQGRCCAFELHFCKHTHTSYWTFLFQREREREREPLYGKCLWPGWQLGLMDGLPPSGCSACNKFPCSCLTSLTYQTHLSLLGRPRGTHNYEARCRQGAGIVLFMGPGPRAKSPKNR